MPENFPHSDSSPDFTVRDYMRIIFRHQWVIVFTVLAVGATVAFGLKIQTPTYIANVKMLISSVKETQAPYSRDLNGYDRGEPNITQSEIVKSTPVLERAVHAVHLDKRPLDSEKPHASKIRRSMIDREVKDFQEQLSKMSPAEREYILFRRAVNSLQHALTVEPVRGTSLLLISVEDFDPLVAATLANVVSRSYVIFDLEQQLAESATKYGELHPSVTLLKGHVEQMNKTLNGEPLDNIAAIGPATVKIISQASIPTQSQGRSKKIVFLLAIFLSFILGLGLAFVLEYLDPTVRSALDLGTIFPAPLLTTIPKQSQNKILRDPDEEENFSKSSPGVYYQLACQIRHYVNYKQMKVFLFTAADVAEGNTTVICNLGMCLANDFKKKVLIIDANYHQSGVHKNFDNSVSPGLVEILSGQIALTQACREIKPDLWILPSGDAQVDPESLLDSQKMYDIICEAKSSYEVVLVDCADLRHYRDAISLGPFVDGTIVVVSEGKTRRAAIRAAIAPLPENNFPIIGWVLNRRTFALPKFIYDRV